MRAPMSLRPALTEAFEQTPQRWVCITQAIVTIMEGHPFTVRDMAARWSVSVGTAHRILTEARETGAELGLIPPKGEG